MTNLDYHNSTSSVEESFRDSLATVDSSGKRKWIHAQKPKGKWYKRRSILSYVYFLLFFGMPFLKINGIPFFQINIPEGKFILFTKVFWPQDFFIFGLGMVTFIVFIVVFTTAFGRLFCGWACPQTIFMEMLFRKLEFWIEGDAQYQKVLKAQPWNTEKIVKKSSKHLSFFLLSFLIANTFLAYIIGIDELYKIITESPALHWKGLLSLLTFTAVFYAVYAFFREQACTVVCPYGRLQGVLLDKNSMIVAYDYKRGEPRLMGKRNEPDTLQQAGDCIDCKQCVKVCPTGIDIRNGVQMECVGCTACIDACDAIMIKVNKPTGLIRYASENGIQHKEPLRFTTRMKLYSLLLSALVGLLAFMLYSRKDVVITVMRAPGMLYQERADAFSNLYNVKFSNKTAHPLRLVGHIQNQAGTIQLVGTHQEVVIPSQGQAAATFFVLIPEDLVTQRKTAVSIIWKDLNSGKELDRTTTSFLGPAEP
jgi:cytochrome c oxidase accessory protein FixG